MKLKDMLELTGNGLMYVFTATQTKEIFEIVSLVLTILISVLIIISKIMTWYKKANEDGRISKEEIKEGIDIISDGVNDLKDKLGDKEEK